MSEIETLKALLNEANEKIKWLEAQRVLSAANNLANMLTFDEAIKKIETLEKALEYANRVNRRLEEREHFLMEELKRGE